MLENAGISRFFLTGLEILADIMDKGNSHRKYLLAECQLTVQTTKAPYNIPTVVLV